jgi:hypothetical protein
LPAGHLISVAGLVVLVATVIAWPLTRRAANDTFALLIHGLGIVLFVFAGDFGPAVLLAIAGVGIYVWSRWKPVCVPGSRKVVLLEYGMVALVYGLYELGRFLSVSAYAPAAKNARDLVSFEQALGIFHERAFQDLVTGPINIEWLLNLVYSHGFLAFVMATLAWTYATNPRVYRLLRNAMGVSALLSVVTSGAFPVAPPRLMPSFGITDTVTGEGGTHRLANAYAAMPSLHVGWMVLSGIGLAMYVRGVWRIIVGALPGAVMLIVVVTTGNHYWIDGVVGTAYGVIGIGISEAARREHFHWSWRMIRERAGKLRQRKAGKKKGRNTEVPEGARSD